MRKFVSLLAAVSLIGCNGDSPDEADTDATPEAVEQGDAQESLANTSSESADSTDSVDPDNNIPDAVNPQAEIRPVQVGVDGPDFDACGSYGEVTGLKADGDNFLSVRGSPFVGGYELDRLAQGQGVAMCDSAEGWVGIVYDKSGEKDCGTGSPIATKGDYEGPCDSGWVSEEFVTLVAG